MRRAMILAVCLALLALVTPAAMAHWYVGDGHNMHYPQLPDAYGWDVEFFRLPLGDDWTAEAACPISEFHIWTSWYFDDLGYYDVVSVEIFDDAGGVPGNWLWGQIFDAYEEVSPYGYGQQGFYNPPLYSYEAFNHEQFQQINLYVTEDPFLPVVGETYWLVVWVDWFTGIQSPPGWKSSLDEWGSGGVWLDNYDGLWYPLLYPTGKPMHLAFVVGPQASPVESTSWSQIKALYR